MFGNVGVLDSALRLTSLVTAHKYGPRGRFLRQRTDPLRGYLSRGGGSCRELDDFPVLRPVRDGRREGTPQTLCSLSGRGESQQQQQNDDDSQIESDMRCEVQILSPVSKATAADIKSSKLRAGERGQKGHGE